MSFKCFLQLLWDHDTFVKEYLGKVSLTLDDIRKLSNSDHSHWFQLKETKTGSVELKIKILPEECEVTFLHEIIISIVVSIFLNKSIFTNNRSFFRPKVHVQPALSAIILLI